MLVVDANIAVVMDCVEKVDLCLRRGILAAYPGDGNSIDEVSEIGIMKLQKTGKEKKNQRREIPKRLVEIKNNNDHGVQEAELRRKRTTI